MAGSTGTRTGTTAGHFRCPVPVPLPLIFPGTGTLSSPEIWTGSRTGSTGPPEVPVTVAVLPLSTSGGNFRRHFRLFSQVLDVLESPGFWPKVSPVLPLNRKYRRFQRNFRSCGFSSLAVGRLFWVGRKYRPLGRYYRSCGNLSPTARFPRAPI